MTSRERAAALRAEGCSYARIARMVGVSNVTVWRWLNPDGNERGREAARAWKRRNLERVRERDREYALRRRLGEPKISDREPMPYDRFLDALHQQASA